MRRGTLVDVERMRRIDLNCDLGEDDSAEGARRDEELCRLVSSINVACGGHAGDDASMARAAAMARAYGLALGAHPSYPDRARFGRAEMSIAPGPLADEIASQVRRLASIAAEAGVVVTHVKAHGALYHASMRDAHAGDGACEALIAAMRSLVQDVRAVGPTCAVVVQAGPVGDALAARCVGAGLGVGLGVVREAFADRRYEADGSLTPRNVAGAVLSDAAAVAEQARGLVCEQRVAVRGGEWLAMTAQTLCVHSDSPDPTGALRAVRERLAHDGVVVAPI
jgi:UPF0271 protein